MTHTKECEDARRALVKATDKVLDKMYKTWGNWDKAWKNVYKAYEKARDKVDKAHRKCGADGK